MPANPGFSLVCSVTVCSPLWIGWRPITSTLLEEKAPRPGRAVKRPISIGSFSGALVSLPLPSA